MKKIVLTLMLCLSCATCFADEVALMEARQGRQFVASITKMSHLGGNEHFDAFFKEMHTLGYIPHKVTNHSCKGTIQKIYITWIRTHLGVR